MCVCLCLLFHVTSLCSCIADPVPYASSRLGRSLAVYMPSKKPLFKLSLNKAFHL